MVLGLFRKDPRRAVIETLYQRIAAASRVPVLYLRLGVADTLEGRFEALCLHVILVLRRLGRLPPPADEVAQELVDELFRNLDASLREMGVGDLTVPKRMKTLAGAFYGRVRAYDAAIEAGDDRLLALSLARNVGATDRTSGPLAAYVRACDQGLAELDLDALLTHGPRFAQADRVAEEAGP